MEKTERSTEKKKKEGEKKENTLAKIT